MFRKLFARLPRQRSAQRPVFTARLELEGLEQRLAPAGVNVLTFHNDIASQGADLAENQLTPVNVKVGSFGKLFATAVDGQVYTQPLIDLGVTIANGPNTSPGAAGTHDVVFIATEHDSLYAIDASATGGGAILWQRSFLDTANPSDNTLGATAISAVPNGDLGSADISPEIGITGTPVIDAASNTLYLVAKTKETIGGAAHYVQRLHAINLADGTDRIAPYLIGDTTGTYTNNTQIYVYGSGAGNTVDPYNGTGKQVVQFNAQREHQRGALSLVNNTVYVEWASHGDNGPYHGWIVAVDVTNLTTAGWKLKGVLNTNPNGSLDGVWQGGGRLAFEADGSAFYFETGNGTFDTTLDANGFPVNGDYGDSLVKAALDPTTSPTNQNKNGWGMKVVDYFTPYNQASLDSADQDLGSGAPMLLPDSAGIAGHPHLLVAAGKQGKIYLVDRDNLGKFDPNNDHVVNAVPDGSGHNTPPVVLGGSISTAAFFNGKIYWVSGYSDAARSFSINANGTLSTTSQTTATFGYLPGSPSISATGTTGGIIWVMDRNANLIHAYDAGTFATELWNSGQKAGGADNLGAVVKMAAPTVANGEVFVGTYDSLVVYGLTPPATSVPNAPTNLTATALSGSSINLTWQDSTTAPNTASGYYVEESTDNMTFSQVTTAPPGATSLAVGGLQSLTTYYFRMRGFNGLGPSQYSNVTSAGTTNQVAVLDFSAGFANSKANLTYNGSAILTGTKAELTTGAANQAGSVFSTAPVDITRFMTQFTFQLTAGTNTADGFTFAIQGRGTTALGPTGGGLGYGGTTGGIPSSVAVKFDLYNNHGEGSNSTGLYLNGAAPTNVGSIDLTPSGINLHSGDVFQVNLAYDGTTLTVTITDTLTGKSATQSYTVNVPSMVGANTACVGFTGGTGGVTVKQDILTWTFAPNATQAPGTPSGLGGEAASATAIALSWTNNAANQSGFHLDRATDNGFTQSLITQNLPGSPNNFTDTAPGLAPGSTFYYRLRAFNTAGDSGNSNVAVVSIPVAPAKPANVQVLLATTTEIDLTWTDNAGRTADGYRILRQANNSSGFIQVANLPTLNSTPPAPYPTWADTNLTPGTYYEYHVIAYNVAGYNDFAGSNATTLTLPPAALTAVAGNAVVNLSWTAATGAVTYNVYRGTSAGGEGATPLATGINATSFSDTGVSNGTLYFYKVTAVNANATRQPALPAESAASNEASVAPGAPPPLDFSTGFAGSTSKLTYNGSALIKGTRAELTTGASNQAGSVFSSTQVNVARFTTQFTFQLSAGIGKADGFTFTIQGKAATALGPAGGGLGYGGTGGIPTSVAVKFDLYSNQGEGPNSTGLYVNGASPTSIGSIDLTPTGINLHSGDIFQVNMTYDGTTLAVTIKDTVTGKSATQSYAINIPGTVGKNTAYIGFTGGSGGATAVQDILTWTFTPTSG